MFSSERGGEKDSKSFLHRSRGDPSVNRKRSLFLEGGGEALLFRELAEGPDSTSKKGRQRACVVSEESGRSVFCSLRRRGAAQQECANPIITTALAGGGKKTKCVFLPCPKGTRDKI